MPGPPKGSKNLKKRKRPYEWLYTVLRREAKHPVLITYEQFLVFCAMAECHYCGVELDRDPVSTNRRNQSTFLDRKDCKQPYTVENLVACCDRCNKGKNVHFSYEEWKRIGAFIRSWSAA